ncbi:hypothetical protein BLJAPNOD_02991 [Ensifer sp. M14]|uniref:hypothetical protein n=1 Tax=Ensifer sp. M14 TaxID=2203782 RepID=UPI000E1CF346|nr:hypothetical protein [Ensifer sp. M14]RDL51845.1 hypothetical protein BLJAPNOD_02991 [Ensifer sp. M14]
MTEYDVEVLKAEVRQELKLIRRMQNELRMKITSIDAGSSVYLLRRVALLEAHIREMRDRDERRRARSAEQGAIVQ